MRKRNDTYTAVSSIRLTEAEWRALRLLAQRDGRTNSAMIREIIRNEAKAAGVWEVAVNPDPLPVPVA